MILILKFEDLPPMPRNRSHMLIAKGKRPMNIKTPLCREFEKDLELRMKQFTPDVVRFRASYNLEINYISAEYYIFTPREQLFTLKGAISSKSVDLDAHKVMQDTIFRSMDMDDKLIRDARYFSPISHDGKWNYVVIYKLEKLCNLENTSTLIRSTTELMNDNSMYSVLL